MLSRNPAKQGPESFAAITPANYAKQLAPAKEYVTPSKIRDMIAYLADECKTEKMVIKLKCLNCGKTAESFLCHDCQTQQILDKIFNEIRFYTPESCENPYLAEYAAGLTEKYAERDIIPVILEQFDFEISEYYYCQYYMMRFDPRFEKAALAYLNVHDLSDIHTQNVLYYLVERYIPDNFTKPKRWCELIAETDGLCCELYAEAAKYFSMIGEYDLADKLTEEGLTLCADAGKRKLLFYSPENMINRLERQKADTDRYRTKRPYWPTTEKRRRAIAAFYDERGIKHPRIDHKPKKIKESEFASIKECNEENLTDYCAFWCEETFGVTAAKGIHQIAAARVRDGVITEKFQSLVRPWDGIAEKKYAAKMAGVEFSVIENSDEVDQVMPKFFGFVGNDVLVSTGALGNQAKLLSRAARYAGMKEIKNEFCDLLDLAADTSAEFDLANNTREYLIAHFSLTEGKTALEKAEINKELYDALMKYGE